MYCPEHKVFVSRLVSVWLYWRDVPRETIPLRVWLNPLNYEVSLFTWTWSHRRRRQLPDAQPAPGVGGDWQVFYLATIKALASMVNVHTPDKLFDLDAIPRDPIMKQVVRIRAAMDDYGKTLLSTRPAESVAQGGIPAGWTIREEHGALLVGSPIGGPGSKWMALEDRGTLERRLLIALAQTLMTPTPAPAGGDAGDA